MLTNFYGLFRKLKLKSRVLLLNVYQKHSWEIEGMDSRSLSPFLIPHPWTHGKATSLTTSPCHRNCGPWRPWWRCSPKGAGSSCSAKAFIFLFTWVFKKPVLWGSQGLGQVFTSCVQFTLWSDLMSVEAGLVLLVWQTTWAWTVVWETSSSPCPAMASRTSGIPAGTTLPLPLFWWVCSWNIPL